MKWINGLTDEAKDMRLSDWHRWFAWRPVVIGYHGEGRNRRSIKVWLRYVWRKGRYYTWFYESGWSWEYKENKPEDEPHE